MRLRDVKNSWRSGKIFENPLKHLFQLFVISAIKNKT